jgi:ADP-ribosylglycohydrolase
MSSALDRALISLHGLATGDAFGETLFGPPAESARRVAERRLSARIPWPWTDDTAMALSIVEVLGRRGTMDPDELAAAFARRWAADPHRGYGQGAFNLLTRVAHGAPWRAEAQRMFSGTGSMGNGAAMRAAPIGAYFADDLDRVVAEALRSAEPTHAHPEGAAGAVAVAVAAALAWRAQDEPFDPPAFFAEVIARTPEGRTRAGIAHAAAIPSSHPPADVAEVLGTGLQVTAPDTVPWCIWVAARHLGSYEDALWTAAGPEGDRDTNAAIVGGIVVLATGPDTIPVLWRAAAEPIPDPLA